MQIYQNINGDSGVAEYEIGIDSITVQFKDSSVYRYTYGSAGSANIEAMKGLAASGDGLNAYINRNVRKLYAAKLR
jgi:hypothetical protein